MASFTQTHILYDTQTNKITWRGPEPYHVPGGPELADHLLSLELIDEPAPQYDPRRQRATRTAWQVDGTAYRRGWVLTDYTIEEIKERKINRIDDSVRDGIEQIIPQSSQLRAVSRAAYLLRRISKGVATDEELAEADVLESLEADTLQPIRDQGQALKDAVNAATTIDELLEISDEVQ